jgi:hypothetical protein
LTIELIEVPEETFALFVNPEKASSFSSACRKFHQEGHDRMQIRHRSHGPLPPAEAAKADDRPADVAVNIIFFGYSDAAEPREAPARASIDRGFPVTG